MTFISALKSLEQTTIYDELIWPLSLFTTALIAYAIYSATIVWILGQLKIRQHQTTLQHLRRINLI